VAPAVVTQTHLSRARLVGGASAGASGGKAVGRGLITGPAADYLKMWKTLWTIVRSL